LLVQNLFSLFIPFFFGVTILLRLYHSDQISTSLDPRSSFFVYYIVEDGQRKLVVIFWFISRSMEDDIDDKKGI